ncbi:MAG: hypothetical protein JKY65_21015 [Planctomycetes bacterium]|nr:hypothetical protein [Planctomycetota bacterium]
MKADMVKDRLVLETQRADYPTPQAACAMLAARAVHAIARFALDDPPLTHSFIVEGALLDLEAASSLTGGAAIHAHEAWQRAHLCNAYLWSEVIRS